MTAPLTITRATIAIGSRRLLGPLTLSIGPGQITTIMGPSGSGKSSLLAWLCGALDDGLRGSGEVCLGADRLTHLSSEQRRLGLLFQDDLLFPHLSVGENLGFALPAGLPRGERRARIAEALAQAEMPGVEARDPASLSGGQRARIALMRTLLAQPRALLLDEPFSRLDAALRDRFRALVFTMAGARQLPCLMVTHDASDAAAAGGDVIDLPAPFTD